MNEIIVSPVNKDQRNVVELPSQLRPLSGAACLVYPEVLHPWRTFGIQPLVASARINAAVEKTGGRTRISTTMDIDQHSIMYKEGTVQFATNGRQIARASETIQIPPAVVLQYFQGDYILPPHYGYVTTPIAQHFAVQISAETPEIHVADLVTLAAFALPEVSSAKRKDVHELSTLSQSVAREFGTPYSDIRKLFGMRKPTIPTQEITIALFKEILEKVRESYQFKKTGVSI